MVKQELYTYVFRDWNGLFHIVQSLEKTTNAYVDWLVNHPNTNEIALAIDVDDLKQELEKRGIEKVIYIAPK